MNSNIVKLAIVALVAVALAVWAGLSRTPDPQALSGNEPLVPGLADSVNAVTKIRIIAAGNAPIVTLEKRERGFVVAEKDGYSADVGKVREFLLRVANATLLEPKTSIEASYPKLGVEDVAKPEADGALVELEGLKAPARVIVGHYSGRAGDGTFVRRADEKQSWLAKGNLTVDKMPANWLAKEVVDLPADRVAEVVLTTDGETVRAKKEKAEDVNYALVGVPAGREPASDFVANSIASVPVGLRFDDVLKASAVSPGDAKQHVAEYRTFDGLVVTATAWEADDKGYATFDAKAEKPEVEKEAATLDARFEGWVYVLPAYKVESMKKTMDELTKPVEKKT